MIQSMDLVITYSSIDMMRYALVLDKIAEIPDCISQDCDSCSTNASGLNSTSEKLYVYSLSSYSQQISRIVQTQAQTAYEGILESIKMHREMVHSFHELSIRRKAAISATNIQVLVERLTENRKRLDLAGFSLPFEQVDKIKMQIGVDEGSVLSQTVRIEFIRKW
jgi:hypothetical protein